MIKINSRQFILGSAISLAALTMTAGTAFAGGDVNYGSGLARHQAAVPVPAPIPVPEYHSGYYLRLDAAYAQGDVSKYRTTDRNADAIRADSYVDNHARFGLGMGYYFNRWLRGDITFDQRNDVESRGTGTLDYRVNNGLGNPVRMRDTISESLKSSNSTGLVNAYVDVPMNERFTGYIGAGLGFARHQVKSLAYQRSAACIGDVAPNHCDTVTAASVYTNYAKGGGTDYALAAALMAGVSFKITTHGKLDLGYRWLHLQGTTFTTHSTTNTVHNLTIPDQNIHELRVGLRYDIF